MSATAADKKFLARVQEAGGEVLAPTNPYEVMRFKTRHGVGVVYQTARGARTWNKEAKLVRDHFSDQKGGSLSPVSVRGRRKGAGTVNAILERDGGGCFFCRAPLNGDITVEHLVSIAHGGPNHISNLFLAHAECNQQAGHLSAPEKIAIRERTKEQS
jgi:hypothetical protein